MFISRFPFNKHNLLRTVKRKISTKSSRSEPKLKSFAIPSIMMSGYFFLHLKRQFSNKLKLSQEKFRRLSLEECRNLHDGEMKEVKFGSKDTDSILVVKYQGELRALSNFCPHFGAPLHTGVLIDNLLKCPWHGASFDIHTGQTDISPAMDNLPTYEVLSDEKGIYVNLPEEVKNQKVAPMSKRDPNDNRRFVIIGGGPAGLSAAETLRQSGYTGEITIISKDKNIPYDRTILSKFFPSSVSKVYLRTSEFLKEYDIDIMNNITVTEIDNQNKHVKLQDGTELSYDKLLLSTGGSPILPNIKGIDNPNVYVLRTFEDRERIEEACKSAKNIVIIGGSFIGMESASSLKKSFPKAKVVVIEKSSAPFQASLGKEVGSALRKLHEDNGVVFKMQKEVSEIKTGKVILNDDSSVPADVVLVGVGITPNSDFIGTKLAKDRAHVRTDKYLTTSDENVFAAGDIASFPYFRTGDYIVFGHYVSALQQGSVAALNMLGNKISYDYVPFFWSRQWDKSIQYTGNGMIWDDVFIDGNLNELQFVAYYIKEDKVVAFATMNTPNAANVMYEAFRNDKVPRATLIKNGAANLETIKNSLKNVKVKCKRADCVCERRRKAAQEGRI